MTRSDKPNILTHDKFQIISPYLEKARKRLYWYSVIPELKKLTPEDFDFCWERYVEPLFAPPASLEEEKIMILAEIAACVLYWDETMIDSTIKGALPEIDEAYNVVLIEGGGWSSYGGDRPAQRKAAVLNWFKSHQSELSYLKKSYLNDSGLYEDGGGQEKRNFYIRLLLKIINDEGYNKLTFKQILSRLKKIKKPSNVNALATVFNPIF